MTNLINPKPRFGYDPDKGMIYDYILQRDVPVSPSYPAADGTWNLVKVRDLIIAGTPIEAGRINSTPAPAHVLKTSGQQPTPAQQAAAAAALKTNPAAGKSPAEAAAAVAAAQKAGTQPQTPAQKAFAAAAAARAAKAGKSASPARSHVAGKGPAFTAVQLAALGITQAQVDAGLSHAQKSSISMTPARAAALKLNAEQIAYLKA